MSPGAVAGAIGQRAPAVEVAPLGADKIERARETSDLMWRLSNYKAITCDCGVKLRVPPKFKETEIRCPHCGRINTV